MATLDITGIRNLPLAALEPILDLAVTPNFQAGGIIDDVREQVVLKCGALGDPALRDSVIAGIVSDLVPPLDRHRINDFFQITRSWDFAPSVRDLSPTSGPFAVSDETLAVMAQEALQGAYIAAVNNLVHWAEARHSGRRALRGIA